MYPCPSQRNPVTGFRFGSQGSPAAGGESGFLGTPISGLGLHPGTPGNVSPVTPVMAANIPVPQSPEEAGADIAFSPFYSTNEFSSQGGGYPLPSQGPTTSQLPIPPRPSVAPWNGGANQFYNDDFDPVPVRPTQSNAAFGWGSDPGAYARNRPSAGPTSTMPTFWDHQGYGHNSATTPNSGDRMIEVPIPPPPAAGINRWANVSPGVHLLPHRGPSTNPSRGTLEQRFYQQVAQNQIHPGPRYMEQYPPEVPNRHINTADWNAENESWWNVGRWFSKPVETATNRAEPALPPHFYEVSTPAPRPQWLPEVPPTRDFWSSDDGAAALPFSSPEPYAVKPDTHTHNPTGATRQGQIRAPESQDLLGIMSREGGKGVQEVLEQALALVRSRDEKSSKLEGRNAGNNGKETDRHPKFETPPGLSTPTRKTRLNYSEDEEGDEEDYKPHRRGRNKTLDDSVASSTGCKDVGKTILKVEFPKAKLTSITGASSENIEELLAAFERRIKIPNGGRDPPPLDKLELLRAICQKDADREQDVFMKSSEVAQLEADGDYETIYEQLKRHLISNFQRPLLERQQQARNGMNGWSMGTKDFIVFQAGWRERLQTLREVKLEPAANKATSEQQSALLNDYLGKLRKDVRVHILLKVDNPADLTLQRAEELARKYCSAQDNEAAIQTGGTHTSGDKVRTQQEEEVQDPEQVNAIQWTDAVQKAGGGMPNGNTTGNKNVTGVPGLGACEKCHDCGGFGHRSPQCPNIVSKKQGVYGGIMQKIKDSGGQGCRTCAGSGHTSEHHNQKPPPGTGNATGVTKPGFGNKDNKGQQKTKTTSNAGKICRFITDGQPCPFGGKCKFSHTVRVQEEGSEEQGEEAIEVMQEIEADEIGDRICTIGSVRTETGKYKTLGEVPGWEEIKNPGPGKSKLMAFKFGKIECRCLPDSGSTTCTITEKLALEIINRAEANPKEESPIVKMNRYDKPSIVRGFLSKETALLGHELVLKSTFVAVDGKEVTKPIKFKIVPGAACDEVILSVTALIKLQHQLREGGHEFHALGIVCPYLNVTSHACNQIVADHVRIVNPTALKAVDELILGAGQSGYLRTKPEAKVPETVLWLQSQTLHEGIRCYEGPIETTQDIMVAIVCNQTDSTVIIEPNDVVACVSSMNEAQLSFCQELEPVSTHVGEIVRAIRGAGLPQKFDEALNATGCFKVPDELPHEVGQGGVVKYPDTSSEEYRRAVITETRQIGKLAHLSPPAQALMEEVMYAQAPALWIEGAPPTRIKGVQFDIELAPDARPVRVQPMKASPEEMSKLERKIQKELQRGTLKPLNKGQWSSRAFTVYHPSDPDGRMVIDYRPVNKVTFKMSFPAPNPTEILQRVAGSLWQSLLDALWGFNQVELSDRAKEILAIVTWSGLYGWEVLPMGVTNGPPAYQQIMQHIFCECLWHCLAIFIDDCDVYSSCVIRACLRTLLRVQPNVIEKLKDVLVDAMAVEPDNVLDTYMRAVGHESQKVNKIAEECPTAMLVGWVEVAMGSFLHLFSGPACFGSLAEYLLRYGNIPTLEVDIIRGFDILDNGKFESLLFAARQGYFVGCHAGFPCETYCGLRNEHDGGPKPLRTRECPSGKPQSVLSDRDWQQLQRANEISHRGLVLIGLISRGRAGATVSPPTNSKTTLTKRNVIVNPCSAENPADLGNGPSFWHHRWKELQEHGLVTFAELDHCMFEGVLHNFRHPLWIAANFDGIAVLEDGHVCIHPPEFHDRCRGRDPDTGKFKTAGTAAYPTGLNRQLARVIIGQVKLAVPGVVCRMELEASEEHATKGKLSIFELIEKERALTGEWDAPQNMSDENDGEAEATAMHVGLLTALDKLVCPEEQARNIIKQILANVSTVSKQSVEWKEWLRFEELMLKHPSCSVHLVWHAVCLDRVLGLAVKAGLGFKLAKAKIAEWEIILLGNKTGRAGTSPDESKVATLRTFPIPPDPGAVRRFMGLANFIRPFAGADFAKKAAPLQSTLQTGGESKFPLKGAELQSFLDVRESVAQDALLACADYRAARNWEKTGRPFEVFLDASDYHIGATLAQLDAKKLKYRPLAYHSESLAGAQRNWIVWEKELFAMRRSKEKFQGITSGYMTIYHTDHLNSVRLDALPPGVNSAKLIRWYQYINDGTSRIQALAGKANPAADCLSRPTCEVVKRMNVSNGGGLRDGAEYVDDGKVVKQIVRVMVLPGYEVQMFDEEKLAETLSISGGYLPGGFDIRVFIADPPFLDSMNVPRWFGSESRTEHIRLKDLKSQGKACVMSLRRQVVQFKPRVMLAYGQSAVALRLALDPEVVRWAEKETVTDVDSALRQAQAWSCIEVFGFVEGGMLPPGRSLNEMITVFPCLKNVISVSGVNFHDIGLSSSYRHDGRTLAASMQESVIFETARRNGWPEKVMIQLDPRPREGSERSDVVKSSAEFSWREEQLKDSKCVELLEVLQGTKAGRKFQVVDRSYEVVNGALHKVVPDVGSVVVVPASLKKQILYDCHNNLNGCHQPPEGLVRTLKERFYWDGMAKDAARWVACCKSCTARRRRAQKPSASIVRHKPPFYRVQIDLVGPLIPASHDFKYIFVMICPSCRWPVLKPLKSKNKAEVAFAMLNCLLEIGTFPPVIQCDRGREFLNQLMTQLIPLLGSSMSANPSYTPRLLGVNEGSHKVMMASLSIALVEYVHAQLDRWSEFLPAVQHVLRGQPIGTTGKSPYDICQTWRHFAPVDTRLGLAEPWTTIPQDAVSDDDVRSWLAALKRVSMQVHDAYVADVTRYQDQLAKSQWKPGGVAHFGVGDLVFLTRPPRLAEEGVNVSPKLLERAEGPYLIVDMQGDKRAFLGDKQGNLVTAFEQPVATSRLISYPGEWKSEWDREDSEESDDDMGVVSDDGTEDHPPLPSLKVGNMVALYSNSVRLGMVSEIHPNESCVTLRLFCRLDDTKQTGWVPAFFEPNCEENYKHLQAIDNGKPAFTCISIKRIFKLVELDRGMLRNYRAAEVPRH